jgi:hypothetical protein
LDLFFVTGVMNGNQRDVLKDRMTLHSELLVDEDRWVISTLVTYPQLIKVYEEFTQLSKEWRGQYYVITNKFVEVCKAAL